MTRVVSWFSRGATSAVATKLAINEHGPDVVVACIALADEHPDSARYAAECEAWFGVPITYLHSDKYVDTEDVFRTREPDRRSNLLDNEPFLNLSTPLIDRGLNHDDCEAIVEAAGIDRAAMYELGYSNNNCLGCVKGGMGYWNAIRVDFPKVFAKRARLEREIGHAICSEEIPGEGRKKRPVWLDELDPDRGDFKRDQPRSCSLMCPTAIEELT